MLKLLQQIWLLQWKFFTCCRQEVGKTKLSRIQSRNKRQTPETGNSMHLPVVSPLHLVVKTLAFVCHLFLQHRKLTRLNENKQLLYVGQPSSQKNINMNRSHKKSLTYKIWIEVSIKSIFNTVSLMYAFPQLIGYAHSPDDSGANTFDWYEELTLTVAVVWSSRKTVGPDFKW